MKVEMYNGDIERVSGPPQPHRFVSTRLRAFKVGRALLMSDRGYVWQLFTEEFENVLMNEALGGPQQQVNFNPPRMSTILHHPSRAASPDSRGSQTGSFITGPRQGNDRNRNRDRSRTQDRTRSRSPLRRSAEETSFALEMSRGISMSMRDTSSENMILSNISVFDGNPRNFGPWKESVRQARHSIEDKQIFRVIFTKLGEIPYNHTTAVGAQDRNLEYLLTELTKQFDEYPTATKAHATLKQLKQDDKSISEHHNEFTRLLRAINEPLSTKSVSLKTDYVLSLSNFAMRQKLVSSCLEWKRTVK